jgi:hypothetical protein
MNYVKKTCTCCKKDHYTLDALTYIGSDEKYDWFNCICQSTLVILPAMVRILDEQGKEFAEDDRNNEQLHIKEHINWERI